MDTPAAAPVIADISSDILPQPSGAIPWITFGGSQGESPSGFVQNLQRIALQQGRSRDDAWMADYAASCFEGDALAWFTELDEDVQGSWKKIRLHFVRKYVTPDAQANPVGQHTSLPITSEASISLGVPASPTATAESRVGRIEALNTYAASRGYLSFDSEGNISLTEDRKAAFAVSFPQEATSDVIDLEIVNPISASYSYIGLGLHITNSSETHKIPAELVDVTREQNFAWNPPQWITRGIPVLSAFCQENWASNLPSWRTTVPFATWVLLCCGKSSTSSLHRRRAEASDEKIRASSAVWRYSERTQELTTFFMMDDNSECELGGYVHKGSSVKLHFHRVSDSSKEGVKPYILDERVRFSFSSD